MLLSVCGLLVISSGCAWMSKMPGVSFRGPLPEPTQLEQEIQQNLSRHVQMLAGDIGERNHAKPEKYLRAEEYVFQTFLSAGYSPKRLEERHVAGLSIHNIEAEMPGTNCSGEILVISAHYDSEEDCPGANDNGSGVAAVLEIARLCARHSMAWTVRFVAFYDEEGFGARPMGSRCYAAEARRKGENIIGMISLETLGYYNDEPKSQQYPQLFRLLFPSYPTTGNFVAFVGNRSSRDLVQNCISSFRSNTHFPSEGLIAPWYFLNAGRSDHASFWREGFPALMVTDTAEFRYPDYHLSGDTPDKLDYARTARVVAGLAQVVCTLAN